MLRLIRLIINNKSNGMSVSSLLDVVLHSLESLSRPEVDHHRTAEGRSQQPQKERTGLLLSGGSIQEAGTKIPAAAVRQGTNWVD